MPIPDLLAAPPVAAPRSRSVSVCGWGRVRPATVELLEPSDAAEVIAAVELAKQSRGSAIPRGMGRSYGDAAQRQGGTVVGTLALKRVILDPSTGVLETGAGATLGEILRESVPRGWLLPVIPGTQHVTVAGAIASDIHGKNHGTAGSFARHVTAFGLLTSSGQTLELSPEDPLFWATAGGMGLTGVILWARIQLVRAGGPLMSVDIDRAGDIDAAFAALKAPGGDYRVAWLDLIGSTRGRGFVTRASVLSGGRRIKVSAAPPDVPARAEVPPGWPGGLLNRSTVRAFNELRYRTTPRRSRGRVQTLGRHLFPLDVLEAWPRLYGPRGFLQYQFVVPFGQERAVRSVIELLRQRRIPPYLVVLKDFGEAAPGPLSFPIPGWTLALDLPWSRPELELALDRCDEIVAEAGGRVYLSKDARLRPETVAHMYPRLTEWRSLREEADPHGLWCSDLAARTGLVEA